MMARRRFRDGSECKDALPPIYAGRTSKNSEAREMMHLVVERVLAFPRLRGHGARGYPCVGQAGALAASG